MGRIGRNVEAAGTPRPRSLARCVELAASCQSQSLWCLRPPRGREVAATGPDCSSGSMSLGGGGGPALVAGPLVRGLSKAFRGDLLLGVELETS
jgi:hypothetical protein